MTVASNNGGNGYWESTIGVAQLFAQERQNMFLSPTAYQARQSLLFKSQ